MISFLNSQQSKARKSVGNTSFTGLSEMFQSPAEKSANDSTLYEDIPDTPNGPNEMFVSPMSEGKSTKGRKSTNYVGVKELFRSRRSSSSTGNVVGVKELMASPKNIAPASPSGVESLFQSPKVRSFFCIMFIDHYASRFCLKFKNN